MRKMDILRDASPIKLAGVSQARVLRISYKILAADLLTCAFSRSIVFYIPHSRYTG